jgi:hypothetical protein
MNDLENRAGPFLESMTKGHSRTLYETGREIVAHWALKTVRMIEFAQEAEHRSVTANDYPALYAQQVVLPSTFIWIAGHDFGPVPSHGIARCTSMR